MLSSTRSIVQKKAGNMKQIAIIASGSRGDVQPYIALGKGLKQAGHEVRLVTHENYTGLVHAHGLEFWPVEGNVQEVVESEAMRERVAQGNFLKLMAEMSKQSERAAVYLAEGGLAACQGVDLLLAGMGGIYTGLALAEKLDLPLLQAYLVPFTPTGDFASVLMPELPVRVGVLNRVTHHFLRQVMWQSIRSGDGLARKNVLGLSPAPFFGPYRSEHMSEHMRGRPVLYGFSPSVVPAPSDWGADVHVTGYWFLDAAADWSPPAALTDFLAAGTKPVYIGFGSMSNRNPAETAELVIEALRRVGQRAVVLSGWGGMHKEDLPESSLDARTRCRMTGCSRAWRRWCITAGPGRRLPGCGQGYLR